MKLKLRPGDLPPGMTLGNPAVLVATFFGAGLMPIAPGTWGSLAALPIGGLLAAYGGRFILFAGVLVVVAAGIWASSLILQRGGVRDPGLIVIDEVAGMWLTLLFIPLTWWGFLLAFGLFRAADVIKPFPANWCDQHVHGAVGVMLDDLVAGLYAGGVTLLISELLIR